MRTAVWLLFAALFAALLPIGLIPPEIHSMINRTMVSLALLSWLAGVLSRQYPITWTVTTSLMASFVIWATLTLVWAPNLEKGATTLFMYIVRFCLLLLIIPSIIRTERDTNGLMKTLAFSGWILILISGASVFSEGYAPGTRLQVLQENSNEVGVLCLITMAGVMWNALQPGNLGRWRRKVPAAIFMLCSINVIAMSGSRGSAISLIITLLVFSMWKRTRSWGKMGVGIIAIMAISAPFIFDTLLERFSVTRGDTVFGGREMLWKAGWDLVRKFPILGTGIGSSSVEVKQYLQLPEVDAIHLHNPILVIWSETGIVGLTLYLGVSLSAVHSFFKQYRRCQRNGEPWLISYFPIVGAVFLGYMASWIKGGGAESDLAYFLMLGLLLVPSNFSNEQA